MNKRFLRSWLLFLGSLWVITAGCSAPLPVLTGIVPAQTSALTSLPINQPSAPITPSLTLVPTRIHAPTKSPFPTNTAEPTLTPTSTLSSEFASLKIVYADDGYLWLWQNYNSIQLTTVDQYTTVSISPSGKQIAFTRNRSLLVINIDGTDERILVAREDMDPYLDENSSYIFFSEWSAKEDKYLIFYTIDEGGPSWYPSEDLYLVNVQAGEWQTIFVPWTGGKVLVSPDREHLAVVSHTSIRLMDFNGTNQRTVLTYEHVLYPTDVPWYPETLWSPDSKSLLVVVPSVNSPNDPKAPTTIWRITLQGSRTVIMQSRGDFSPIFSPDFSRYIEIKSFGKNQTWHDELFIGNITGSVDQPYYIGSSAIYFVEWLPDSTGFIFRDLANDAILVGRFNELPRSLSLTNFPDRINSTSLSWIDSSHYIYDIYTEYDQIWLGTVDGISQPIIEIDSPSFLVFFDFVNE
jgi:hypothetical protein